MRRAGVDVLVIIDPTDIRSARHARQMTLYFMNRALRYLGWRPLIYCCPSGRLLLWVMNSGHNPVQSTPVAGGYG